MVKDLDTVDLTYDTLLNCNYIRRVDGREMYTITLDYPFITDEDIVVDRTFIEPLDKGNCLQTYYSAIEGIRDDCYYPAIPSGYKGYSQNVLKMTV